MILNEPYETVTLDLGLNHIRLQQFHMIKSFTNVHESSGTGYFQLETFKTIVGPFHVSQWRKLHETCKMMLQTTLTIRIFVWCYHLVEDALKLW